MSSPLPPPPSLPRLPASLIGWCWATYHGVAKERRRRRREKKQHAMLFTWEAYVSGGDRQAVSQSARQSAREPCLAWKLLTEESRPPVALERPRLHQLFTYSVVCLCMCVRVHVAECASVWLSVPVCVCV